jgi:ADP-ribosylglycohydrolase
MAGKGGILKLSSVTHLASVAQKGAGGYTVLYFRACRSSAMDDAIGVYV